MKQKLLKTQAGDIPETILFAVTGFSPAVITETVWALVHEKPPVIPGRIIILTTAEGRKAVERELFSKNSVFKQSCVWDALREAVSDAGLDIRGKLKFGVHDINVFFRRDPDTGSTRELGDIALPEDNAAAADQILEHLRRFTENPQTRIIASIAGGRKTMGALLFACMSLIGRETDRITHVLVNQPYDNPDHSPRFYFPAPGKVAGLNPRPKITLADIPFVSLRNRFKNLGAFPGGYNRLVAECSNVLMNEDTIPVEIKLDAHNKTLFVDDLHVKLPDRLYYLMCYLVDINSRHSLPVKQEAAVSEITEFLQRYHPQRKGAAPSDGEELRKRLYSLRRVLAKAGCKWAPGLRENSLRLPGFHVKS